MTGAQRSGPTEAEVHQALRAAMGHHKAGKWDEARDIYDQILSYLPDQPDACHLRGLVALRDEVFDAAEEWIGRAVAADPATADYHANLGVALRRQGRLAEAEAAYRRALAIDPDHPRAVQNLEYVRTLLPDWVPKPESGGLLDSFFFWHKTLARPDRSLGAAIAFAVAVLLLAAAGSFGQSALRTAAILPALVWAALIASVTVDVGGARLDEAVVIADETVARAADSALAPSTLPAPLPGGVEVRILERRSPWIRIRLANGRDAWVAESALMTVAEPGLLTEDRGREG